MLYAINFSNVKKSSLNTKHRLKRKNLLIWTRSTWKKKLYFFMERYFFHVYLCIQVLSASLNNLRWDFCHQMHHYFKDNLPWCICFPCLCLPRGSITLQNNARRRIDRTAVFNSNPWNHKEVAIQTKNRRFIIIICFFLFPNFSYLFSAVIIDLVVKRVCNVHYYVFSIRYHLLNKTFYKSTRFWTETNDDPDILAKLRFMFSSNTSELRLFLY